MTQCPALHLAIDVLGWQVDVDDGRPIDVPSPMSLYGGALSQHAPITMHQHRFTLRDYNGNPLLQDKTYTRGDAVPPPDRDAVVLAVLRDAASGHPDLGDSYESWADDFGYDRDSLSGYRAWEECRRVYRTLRRLPTLDHLIEHIGECEVCS